MMSESLELHDPFKCNLVDLKSTKTSVTRFKPELSIPSKFVPIV